MFLDWSGWYRPSVHRPVGSRASSVSVGPPSVGQELNDVAVGEGDEEWYLGGFGEEIKQEFDQTLVQCYGYPNNGRQLFPPCTHLYNKFAGRVPAEGFVGIPTPIRLRKIKIGRPAIANRLHIGEVVRYKCRTFIHNLGGRKTNTCCSAAYVRNAHHEGRNYCAPGCSLNLLQTSLHRCPFAISSTSRVAGTPTWV